MQYISADRLYMHNAEFTVFLNKLGALLNFANYISQSSLVPLPPTPITFFLLRKLPHTLQSQSSCILTVFEDPNHHVGIRFTIFIMSGSFYRSYTSTLVLLYHTPSSVLSTIYSPQYCPLAKKSCGDKNCSVPVLKTKYGC